MDSESDVVARLLKAYKFAHSEFMTKRNTAIILTVLFAIGLAGCAAAIVFSENLSFKILLELTPLILVAGILAFWFFVITTKIRLEFVKDILEQAGYVIARKTGESDIEILEGPPERLSDFHYFDADLIKALKSGKLNQKEISPESYLVVPTGRINKYYVRLFS